MADDFDILSAVAEVAAGAGGNDLALDALLADYDQKIAAWQNGFPLAYHIERELTRRSRDSDDLGDLVTEFGPIFETSVVANGDAGFTGLLSVEVFHSLWLPLFSQGTLIGLSYIPADGLRPIARQCIQILADLHG